MTWPTNVQSKWLSWLVLEIVRNTDGMGTFGLTIFTQKWWVDYDAIEGSFQPGR
jgi:lipid-A-disaccharide synthase-like uncharacterized protein